MIKGVITHYPGKEKSLRKRSCPQAEETDFEEEKFELGAQVASLEEERKRA